MDHIPERSRIGRTVALEQPHSGRPTGISPASGPAAGGTGTVVTVPAPA